MHRTKLVVHAVHTMIPSSTFEITLCSYCTQEVPFNCRYDEHFLQWHIWKVNKIITLEVLCLLRVFLPLTLDLLQDLGKDHSQAHIHTSHKQHIWRQNRKTSTCWYLMYWRLDPKHSINRCPLINLGLILLNCSALVFLGKSQSFSYYQESMNEWIAL